MQGEETPSFPHLPLACPAHVSVSAHTCKPSLHRLSPQTAAPWPPLGPRAGHTCGAVCPHGAGLQKRPTRVLGVGLGLSGQGIPGAWGPRV